MLRRVGLVLAATVVLLSPTVAVAGTGDIDLPDGGGIDIHGHDDGEPKGNGGGAEPINLGPTQSPAVPVDDCAVVGISGDCPAGGEVPSTGNATVDATDLAKDAYDSIRLGSPAIKMSPQAPAPAIVGLKTWLWLDNGSWSVRRAKAKAGDVTVTAEARPLSVIWDLGEKRIVCHGPGRVWKKGLPREASTPCGYTFRHTSTRQPNDRYRVRVFVNYGVSWRCEGDCDEADGDLGTLASPTAQLDLRVAERQSVVVR